MYDVQNIIKDLELDYVNMHTLKIVFYINKNMKISPSVLFMANVDGN